MGKLVIFTKKFLERRVLGERITEFIKFSYPPIKSQNLADEVRKHFLKRGHTEKEILEAYNDIIKNQIFKK